MRGLITDSKALSLHKRRTLLNEKRSLAMKQIKAIDSNAEDERAARRWRCLKRLEVEPVCQIIHAKGERHSVALPAIVVNGAQGMFRKRTQARKATVLGRNRRREIKRINSLDASLMANLIKARPDALTITVAHADGRAERRDTR